MLAILSKCLFDPAVHAYFGDRVPYAQRGTAVAVTEMAWSAAFIVGVPFMGLLIARFGWSAPFPVLAALGLGMLGVIWWTIPHDGPTSAPQSPLLNVREVLASVPAVAGVLIGLWASAANEMVNLNFGVWLASSFGLQIAALAGASAVIGLAGAGRRKSGRDRDGQAREGASSGSRSGGATSWRRCCCHGSVGRNSARWPVCFCSTSHSNTWW